LKSLTALVLRVLARGIERTDAHAIRFVGRDMAEVMDFIVFLDYYSPDMTP
jgi:hypothetical protein